MILSDLYKAELLCMMTVKYSRDPHIQISVSILAGSDSRPLVGAGAWCCEYSLYDNNSRWSHCALHRHTY